MLNKMVWIQKCKSEHKQLKNNKAMNKQPTFEELQEKINKLAKEVNKSVTQFTSSPQNEDSFDNDKNEHKEFSYVTGWEVE